MVHQVHTRISQTTKVKGMNHIKMVNQRNKQKKRPRERKMKGLQIQEEQYYDDGHCPGYLG